MIAKLFCACLTLILSLAWTPAPAAQPQPRLRAFRAGMPPKSAGVTGLGTVRCFKSLTLGFSEKGILGRVMPEEGDQVRRGQVVARLDDRVLKAQMKAKRTELENARQEAAHLEELKQDKEKLYKSRAIPYMELKEAQHKLYQAKGQISLLQAELAGQKARLSVMSLKSPISGTVIERLAEPGEVVEPGSGDVLVVMQCGKVLAEVAFGEKLYGLLQKDQPVLVVADAVRNRDFVGRVYAKSPKVDDKDRTFKVKVLLKNPHGMLRPGMFVRATLLAGGKGRPIWIPQESLVSQSGDEAEVLITKDGRSQKRKIRLGRRQGKMVQSVEGIKPGELVVLPPLKESKP